MRRLLRRLIPQMFHRRLLLLSAVGGVVLTVLVLQTVNLTLVLGNELRGEVEDALVRRRLLPTRRGTIRDRHGRVLARDRAGYNVAVHYDVLTGQWAYEQAARAARTAEGAAWRELSSDEKERLIETHQPPFDDQVRYLWRYLAALTDTDARAIEQRKHDTVRRIHRVTFAHWREMLRRRTAETDRQVTLHDVTGRQIVEQQQTHIMIDNVSDAARFDIMSRQADAKAAATSSVWSQVEVELVTTREYPWSEAGVTIAADTLPQPLARDEPLAMKVYGFADHLIGGVRAQVWREEIADYPYRRLVSTNPHTYEYNLHGYLDRDTIGGSGIERSFERHLRGRRGQVTTYHDGRTAVRVEPTAGRDVSMTIDTALQADIAAIMSPADPNDAKNPGLGLMRSQSWHRKPKPEDKPKVVRDGEALCGAAVVLDVDSSEVLAAVTVPWRAPAGIAEVKAWEQVNQSWINRPIAAAYPPGSSVKPLVLSATYTQGLLMHDDRLPCEPGHLFGIKCWRFKKYETFHDELTGPEAIMRSCNVFFLRCGGQRLGSSRLTNWYGRFGLGRLVDCGIHGEIATTGATGQGPKSAAMMAMGQGPIVWTVLQAAGAYATIARGGQYIAPTFVTDPPYNTVTRRNEDLGLDPTAIQLVLQGLEMSANNVNGTTYRLSLPDGQRQRIFNINAHVEDETTLAGGVDELDGGAAMPAVTVMAKSGTAEAPDLRIKVKDERDRVTQRTVRQGDHAWTIAMVQRSGDARPAFVIAVVVEYAGSGGHVAAPIVNQILHAMRAEGYL